MECRFGNIVHFKPRYFLQNIGILFIRPSLFSLAEVPYSSGIEKIVTVRNISLFMRQFLAVHNFTGCFPQSTVTLSYSYLWI